MLGIVKLGEEENFDYFEQWLAEKKHAGMNFLERNRQFRKDPRKLLNKARSAIIVGLPYKQDTSLAKIRKTRTPQYAQYAKIKDYHKDLKKRGKRLLEAVLREYCPAGERHVGRVCVDSAPLLERALASRTEKGFIGKNTCYIHPQKGSFFLLGEILVSLELPADNKTAVDHNKRTSEGGCGSCQRCKVYCPTGALSEDYRLDANKCLSYYSIEHRGTVPLEFWPWFSTYLFGCDICQLACPYNRHIEPAKDLNVKIEESYDLYEVATMDQKTYEDFFAGTPMTRAKRNGLKRNALIAMTVKNDPRLYQAIRHIGEEADPMLDQTIVQVEQFLKNIRENIDG